MNLLLIGPSFYVCFPDLSPAYRQFSSYSSLIINLSFYVIMIILCILAFKNVRRIRAVPRQKRQEIRTMTKKDFQLLRCLFVQDIVFSIGGGIYSVFQAAAVISTQTARQQALNVFFSSFTIFLHHIPYCANFFIFISVSKTFRNALRRMIYKMFGIAANRNTR